MADSRISDLPSAALAGLDNADRLYVEDTLTSKSLTLQNASLFFMGTHNVKAFGATGDGVTDDTAAVQAAMDAADNYQGSVFFPPGTYLIDGTLTINASGLRMFGCGLSSTLYRDNITGPDMLVGTNVNDVTLESLHFRGPNTNNAASPNQIELVKFNSNASGGCNNIHTRNCIFTETHWFVLVYTECSNSSIKDNVFICGDVSWIVDHGDCTSQIDIYNGADNVLVDGNICVGAPFPIRMLIDDAIRAPTVVSRGVTISHNHVFDAGMYAIHVYEGSGDASFIEQVHVHGNLCSDILGTWPHATLGDVYGAGIYIQGIVNCSVSNNHVRRANRDNGTTVTGLLTPAGIGVINTESAHVVANLIEECTKCGIFVKSNRPVPVRGTEGPDERSILVSGNRISNCGFENSPSFEDGIRFLDVQDASIVGNNVDDQGGGQCISITDNSQRILISGNVCREAPASGIFIQNSNDATIMGNFTEGCATAGIQTSGAASRIIILGNNITGDNNAGDGVLLDTGASQIIMGMNIIRDVNEAIDNRVGFWDAGANAVIDANTIMAGAVSDNLIAFGTNDTTPSVAFGNRFQTNNTVPTTISGFDDGVPGQRIFVLLDGNTVLDFTASNLRGNNGVDYNASAGDAIDAHCQDGTIWNVTIIEG